MCWEDYPTLFGVNGEVAGAVSVAVWTGDEIAIVPGTWTVGVI